MLPATVSAAQFSCGPAAIGIVGQSNDGAVGISAGYGYHLICNTLIAAGSVPTEVCRNWCAQLVRTRATGMRMVIYYDTDNPANGGMASPYFTPGNFGSWQFHPPYYLRTESEAGR